MMISIEQAAINLAVAFCLSPAIGFERQWRNRLAGLRTNTLVALDALHRCATVVDDMARLSCYDSLGSRPAKGAKAPVISVGH
jgi:uncharacterized membrane protein YhiD involved in acid resistance